MSTLSDKQPIREQVAFALWRDESIRAAQRPRTFEQWLDESEKTRDRWRRAAQAALDACQFEEAFKLLRLMRKEYGSHLSICGKTLVAVDTLFSKLEGKL